MKNSIYWGTLGVIFAFIINPIMSKAVQLIPPATLFHINVMIYVIILTDVVVTVNRILFIEEKINQLYEITDKLKEKITELKQAEGLEKVAIQNITNMINELKVQQVNLKINIYKLGTRLKNAFPTMHLPEGINKLIEQKIDLKKVRNKTRKNKEE